MAAFALLVVALFVEAGLDVLSGGSSYLLMGLGLIMAKAIWWDSRHPLRTTRHADVAFGCIYWRRFLSFSPI